MFVVPKITIQAIREHAAAIRAARKAGDTDEMITQADSLCEAIKSLSYWQQDGNTLPDGLAWPWQSEEMQGHMTWLASEYAARYQAGKLSAGDAVKLMLLVEKQSPKRV